MALESLTTAGQISFADGEWDQAGADNDTLTIVKWWLPTTTTPHQARAWNIINTSDVNSFTAEYRDSGGEVDTVVYYRIRNTTNTTVRPSNSFVTIGSWNFTAVVDHGDGGSAPQVYNGTQTTQATEVSGYGVQTAGSGALTNSIATNNMALVIGGIREDLSTQTLRGHTSFFAIYSDDLSLAEIQSIQWNPWACYDRCKFHSFIGDHGTTTAVDHAGGFSSTGGAGTLTLSANPNGKRPFPQIGANVAPTYTAAAASNFRSLSLMGVG